MADDLMTPKSFWQRPEGTTGMVVLAALGLVGGIGVLTLWAPIAAFLATVLQNTFSAMISLAGIVGMVALAANRRFRTLVKYAFKSVMRGITSVFTELDPIGIMRGYIEELRGKYAEIMQKMNQLRGEIRAIRGEIQRNNKDRESALAEADAVRKSTDLTPEQRKMQAALKANQISRLDQANSELEPLAQNMEILYRILDKMREAAQFVLADITDRVDLEDRKRRAMNKGYSAWRSARSIIAGESDGHDLYDQALDFVQDDYERKMGEIEGIVDMSSDILTSADLRTGAAVQKMNDMLSALESKQDAILLPPAQLKQIRASAENSTEVLDLSTPAPIAVPRGSASSSDERYARLLSEDDSDK